MPRLTRNGGPLSAAPTVLALSGTTATPSRTLTLVNIVVAVLRAHGAEVDVWDLARHPLPTADPAFHHQPERHPSEVIQLLVHRAQQADAFVWGSPVYHNSYSGVLKNLLDHLEISQFEQNRLGSSAMAPAIEARRPVTTCVLSPEDCTPSPSPLR